MRLVKRETGQWYNGKWNINYSGILTKLIQIAGQTCKQYASDLFIDWKHIDEMIEEAHQISKEWEFGFRESGVDHKAYVDCTREDGPEAMKRRYKSLYLLKVDGDGDEIQMELYEEEVA